ncbi:MAG: peptidoglycan DD-metalloendopeptidase family protein, partial [Gammaproteobacteria bacterium]
MIRLSLCLALALLTALPGGLSAAPRTGEKSSQTKEDLARVRDRIRGLEKQTREDQARRSELDKQLRVAETAAMRIRRELNATRRELVEAQEQLARINAQIDATQANLERERVALAGQLRLAHMTGGSERVQAFFNQEDPAAIGRRLTWLTYLARRRSELLGAIQASLDALEKDRQAAAEQQATLVALESRRREQLAELDGSRQQRAAVVAKLDAQVQGRSRQLARARNEAASLERVLKELERTAAKARREAEAQARAKPPGKPAVGADPGKPLGQGRWPVAGRMLADFGQPRAGGQMRWDGVLIAAPAGTDVRTTRSGRVVYADWLPGLGMLLVLDHGSGYLSLYGHNQDLSRNVGDQVAA